MRIPRRDLKWPLSGSNRPHLLAPGGLKATDVRDLRGVIDREQAEIGVLLTMDEPTKPMRTEAASAGFYESPWGKHARIQLLTVADVLGGKGIDYPRTAGTNVTLKAAPRSAEKVAEPPQLFDQPVEPLPKMNEKAPKTEKAARKKRGR